LSRQIQIKYYSAQNKIRILEELYLIDLLKNKLNSIRAQEASFDKIFSNSINLLNNVLNITDPEKPLYSAFKGHIIETYIYNAIKSIGTINYYNKNHKEVDLIISYEDTLIPIEVKSSNKLKKTDFNHLLFYMTKNKINTGYMVYSGELDKIEKEGKTIYLLPYWLF